MQQLELTEREWEVLVFLVRGFTDQETADNLVVTKATILFHRGEICAKLGIKTPLTEIQISAAARYDELQRVSEATLDSDTDVWSLTDDGRIISLDERMIQLQNQ